MSDLPSVLWCKTRSLHTLCKLRGIGANICKKFKKNKKNEENLLEILHFFCYFVVLCEKIQEIQLFCAKCADVEAARRLINTVNAHTDYYRTHYIRKTRQEKEPDAADDTASDITDNLK